MYWLLTLGATLLAGAAGLQVWLARRRRGQSEAVLAESAVACCELLLRLIGHLQQHRGMSSAWLGGDAGFGARLAAKRTEIQALLPPLRTAVVTENERPLPCLTVNEFDLLRFKWRGLIDNLAGLSVEQSIAEHSQMIATLLDWLGALGEARVGLAPAGRLPLGLVRNYAHRLPLLTECLGQARAIGSGVAARGRCSAVARVRLMFLISRAESLLSQACSVEQDSRRGSAAQGNVQALATLTRARMLTAEDVDVTAEDYFSQATVAIDAVFAWIEECGQTLKLTINGIGADHGAASVLVGRAS